MKNFLRRRISWILAFAMLAGILPTGTPQAAAAEPMEMAGVKEVYDFLAIDKEKYPADMGNTYDFNVIGKNNYDFSSAQNWAFAYITEEVGLRVQGTYALTFGGLWGTSDWFALKIKVPAAGRYMLQMSHIKVPTGLKADVYILPGDTADIAAALESAESVGELDTYAESETVVSSPEDIGYADFATSGDYIFAIKAHDATSGGKYILPRNLILNGIEIKPDEPQEEPDEPMEWANATRNYDFLRCASTDDWTYNTYPGNMSVVGMPYEGSTNAYWAYAAHSMIVNGPERFNLQPSWFLQFDFQFPGDWGAIKFKVPKTGRYKASMTYTTYIDSLKSDIYILPASIGVENIGDNLSGKYFVGSIDTGSNSTDLVNVDTPFEFGEFNATEEEMIMVVRYPEDETGRYVNFRGFFIDGYDGLVGLDISLPKRVIEYGEETFASVKGAVGTGEKVEVENIEYGTTTPEIIQVDKNTGYVNAIGHGEAVITAKATYEGREYEDSRKVNVIKLLPMTGEKITYELLYNNRTTWKNPESGLYDDIRGITYEHTVPPGEIREGNWEYYALDPKVDQRDSTLRLQFNYNLQFNLGIPDAWAALKLKVNKPGGYRFKITYTKYRTCGKAELYLLPQGVAAANIPEYLNEEYSLGIVDFKDYEGLPGDVHVDDPQLLLPVNIENPGEYIFVVKLLDSGSYDGIRRLILDGTGAPMLEFASLDFNVDKDVIVAGETAKATARAILGSGKPADSEKATIVYESLNPDVAIVDKATGVITGVSGGSTRIKASIIMDGVTRTATCAIKVLQEEGLSRKQEIFDFRRLNDTLWPKRDIIGITYNESASVGRGNWEFFALDPLVAKTDTTMNLQGGWYLQFDLGSAGRWGALKLNVKNPGRYKVKVTYTEATSGSAADLYLLPGDITPEQVPEYLNENYKLATLDTYNPEPVGYGHVDEPVYLCDVDINTAGEYILVVKQLDSWPKRYIMLRTLQFDGFVPIDYVSFDVGEGAIAVGSSRATTIDYNLSQNPDIAPERVKITYETLNPEIVEIDETGVMTGISKGYGTVRAIVEFDGHSREIEKQVVIGSTKTRRSFYSTEKIAAAKENIEKYTWARSQKDSSVRAADRYLGKEDILWEWVTPTTLPRSFSVGYLLDPMAPVCIMCGTDLRLNYGTYPWITDPINKPWKVQCPECRKWFPSNDFESYYKAGLDENGIFQPELAKKHGSEFLVNKDYPEMGEGWGVDDGWGYKTGNIAANGVVEAKTWIAYYNYYGLWAGEITNALYNLKHAYLFTDDIKYGRLGAILVDRIADVYPDFDINQTDSTQWFYVADGGINRGKIGGMIADYGLARDFSEAYDAFFPAYEDPQVISFLSGKAKRYGLENTKTSSDLICLNIENRFLREVYKCVKDRRINGNFGMHQQTLATAAIALDTMPETKEWIDWCFKTGIENGYYEVTGGNIYTQLVNVVDRDGHGNESSPAYNQGWLSNTLAVAETLKGYDGYPEADLYTNPKFIRMLTAMTDITMVSRFTPTIADSGKMGEASFIDQGSNLIRIYSVTKNPLTAHMAYLKNGRSTEGMHADIFVKDPESMIAQLKGDILSSPALPLGSLNLTGYGLATLRDGNWLIDVINSRSVDNQRDFYIWYGRTSAAHSHMDKLNLGVHAYGLDFAPDLGYPEEGTSNQHRLEWMSQTISHNTVVVNEKSQVGTVSAKPLHFDDSGRVKVMDVDASAAYKETSEYRRSVVMVEVDNEVSYGVDFFKVTGGNEHLYSFHALSNQAEVYGAKLNERKGTYAGEDVEWGPAASGATYPKGYNWLTDIRTANEVEDVVSIDWEITDFRKNTRPNPINNLHLKLTMLEGDKLSEFTTASGRPPQVVGNPEKLTYMLAKREGDKLESLFTSVIQPYHEKPYIDNVSLVDVGDSATARAVKVELVDGRVDYIVYNTNNTETVSVDNDLFTCNGFVCVVTYQNGEEIYRYVNDAKDSSIEGQVIGFSEELTTDNYIDITTKQQVDLDALSGKYIYVDNKMDMETGVNAVYRIESAEHISGGIRLHLGNSTLIRAYFDNSDFDAGYYFYIDKGQNFRIPLSTCEDGAPVFYNTNSRGATAGKNASFLIEAVSPIGESLKYSAISLPRGASLSENGEFSWTPDDTQIGRHMIGVTATDGLRSSTAYTWIEVYKSAGSICSSGSGSGSGGGTPGGGGSSSGGGSSDTSDNTGTEDNKDNAGDDAPDVSVVPTEKFIDLGNHAWAKDAIYALVDAGVVNGTSENTYSPAANIKRAEFAIMLVRAFGITEGESEHFTDVDASKYYAKELNLAKANGIVGGVGDNKFNPDGEITRQDMMLMLTRALEAQGKALEEADESVLAQFADAAEISDYARQAVASVVKAGIIAGSNGRINPLAKATRAEIAVMLNRVLAK